MNFGMVLKQKPNQFQLLNYSNLFKAKKTFENSLKIYSVLGISNSLTSLLRIPHEQGRIDTTGQKFRRILVGLDRQPPANLRSLYKRLLDIAIPNEKMKRLTSGPHG